MLEYHDLSFDLKEIDDELVRLNLLNHHQVAFTRHVLETEGPSPIFGLSLGSLDAHRPRLHEVEFVFNAHFAGTVFERIYQQVQEISSYRLGRMRLMRLKAKECYTIHRDSFTKKRFHLAIVTNPRCVLVIGDGALQGISYPFLRVYHIPRDGHIYSFDGGSLTHTALNGSNEDRYHLVLSESEAPR